MSNLERHAEEELRRAGLFDDDADYGGQIAAAVMRLIRVHAAEGHGGFSHDYVLSVFNKVVNFKVLTPVTSDPAEWTDVSEMSGQPMWQNKRQSSSFSKDGGATWYDLNDPKTEDK